MEIIKTPLTEKLGYHPHKSLAELAGMSQHIVDNMIAGEKIVLFFLVHTGRIASNI